MQLIKLKIMNKIEEATQNALLTLRNAGYYIGNLWHVDDVDNNDLSTKEKLDVLHHAIHRDYIYSLINEAIQEEVSALTELKD
jgi:hypothetical protein